MMQQERLDSQKFRSPVDPKGGGVGLDPDEKPWPVFSLAVVPARTSWGYDPSTKQPLKIADSDHGTILELFLSELRQSGIFPQNDLKQIAPYSKFESTFGYNDEPAVKVNVMIGPSDGVVGRLNFQKWVEFCQKTAFVDASGTEYNWLKVNPDLLRVGVIAHDPKDPVQKAKLEELINQNRLQELTGESKVRVDRAKEAIDSLIALNYQDPSRKISSEHKRLAHEVIESIKPLNYKEENAIGRGIQELREIQAYCHRLITVKREKPYLNPKLAQWVTGLGTTAAAITAAVLTKGSNFPQTAPLFIGVAVAATTSIGREWLTRCYEQRTEDLAKRFAHSQNIYGVQAAIDEILDYFHQKKAAWREPNLGLLQKKLNELVAPKDLEHRQALAKIFAGKFPMSPFEIIKEFNDRRGNINRLLLDTEEIISKGELKAAYSTLVFNRDVDKSFEPAHRELTSLKKLLVERQEKLWGMTPAEQDQVFEGLKNRLLAIASRKSQILREGENVPEHLSKFKHKFLLLAYRSGIVAMGGAIAHGVIASIFLH